MRRPIGAILCLERLLCFILLVLFLSEAAASLTLALNVQFISLMEQLVDFIALHQFTHSREVREAKVSLATLIEELEALINVFLGHIGPHSFSTLPELVLVDSASFLIVSE